jgi:hypothetical protein
VVIGSNPITPTIFFKGKIPLKPISATCTAKLNRNRAPGFHFRRTQRWLSPDNVTHNPLPFNPSFVFYYRPSRYLSR